jgi:two-component system phosphate regulon sensor histidine kinase PhoR
VKARLFWKLGLTYVVLLFAVLLSVDFYSSRIERRDYLRAALDQLSSLAQIASSRPPNLDDRAALAEWASWMGKSGARVTVIDAHGVVLADSEHDPESMENHSDRPEVIAAFSTGRGTSVRHSHTLDRDLVYLAIRAQPGAGAPAVLRFAIPLAQVDQALAEMRRRLWLASFLILIFGAIISLLFSRALSARIERLKQFSQRVAQGQFQPLPETDANDELSDLSHSLNETAAHFDRTIRSLTGERNRSAAILRSMVEGVAVIDAKERIVFSNQAFAEILGLEANFEGRALIEAVRQPDLIAVIRKALEGNENASSELIVGTIRPRSFSVTASPVPALAATQSEPAQSQGAVVVLHDITELRRLERVRRDFVANVSHELKTPLTAIQGFAETLLGGALEDRANNERFVTIIRDHSIRLARLTDDLLMLSKIEAGKLEFDFRPVALAEFIEPCLETARLRAGSKGVSLEVECPPNFPPIRGDAHRLREVLQNLLDNALQYTPSGGHVRLTAVARNGAAILTVADTGIGIPQLDQEKIFERFYRVDAARSREAGGTGLGLAIAKHIVEAHGGRLWVESAVGQGSKFHFSIPLVH